MIREGRTRKAIRIRVPGEDGTGVQWSRLTLDEARELRDKLSKLLGLPDPTQSFMDAVFGSMGKKR